MPLWVKRTSWFVAVIVAAAFGHWLATQVATRNAKPIEQSTKASLPIEARSTDFGEVLEDSDFAWTVQLRNLGTEAIEVTRVITSCDDCLQATPQAFELPGGGSSSPSQNRSDPKEPGTGNDWARPQVPDQRSAVLQIG